MSSISAGTSSGTALVNTGDTTGNLVLQTNGTTTALTLNTSQAVGVGSSPSYGTSGQVLTSQGSAASPTWTTPSAGALTLIATITPTAAANVDFLSTFNSTYDNYLVIANGLTPSSYTSSPGLQMRVATGGTVNTGANYSGMANPGVQVATTSQFTGFGIMNQGGYNGMMFNFFNVNDTTQGKAVVATYMYQPNGGATDAIGYTTFGMFLPTGAGSAVSGVRLYWNTGTNFSAVGKIRVYGYSNS